MQKQIGERDLTSREDMMPTVLKNKVPVSPQVIMTHEMCNSIIQFEEGEMDWKFVSHCWQSAIVTGREYAKVEMIDKPIIVCLCGSTRFKDAFVESGLDETLAGKIVLNIGCDMRSDAEIFGKMTPEERDKVKIALDELHFRKIELADEILVLNVDGYIGQSTAREIVHAEKSGKNVRFLNDKFTDSVPTRSCPESIGRNGSRAGPTRICPSRLRTR
jgi:hypothetical protein